MKEAVRQRFEELEPIVQEIAEAFTKQLDKLGFEPNAVVLQTPQQASYRLETDPSDGGQALIGDWLDTRGYRRGGLTFHADGSFFVEQDIGLAHPEKKHWFVEAINAWGRGQSLKIEARLLPMPE